MRKIITLTGLTLACLLGASASSAWAVPTVKEMLAYQPRQKAISVAVPTAEEEATCKVKSLDNKKGYLLFDAHDMPLRKFYDARGSGRIDTWSYYKEGVEVYREIDTTGTNVPNQFRWLNTAGMKWGVDLNNDGIIDQWLLISAEEVAEEVFQAVIENNPKRLQPLFLSEKEFADLNLSKEKADRVRKALSEAPAKFAAALKEMPARSQFVRVEAATPNLVPSEDLGTNRDVLHFSSRAILYQSKDSKHDWLHTGSIIQLGGALRLVDGPSTTILTSVFHRSGDTPATPEGDKLLEELKRKVAELDAQNQNVPQGIINTPAAADYNLKRVQLVQQIIQPRPSMDAKERETWIKQMCDNLGNAYIASTGKNQALTALGQYRDQLLNSKSALAPYAAYRYIWANYAHKLQNQLETRNIPKHQEEYNGELARFVQTYPQAEDTPDALQQLGMGCEFTGRDEEAKRWYKMLAENFPSHALALKATGAVARLSLIGQELILRGRILNTSNTFDVLRLRGKVVVVYYYASYCTTSVGDFAILKKLQTAYGSKGLELVMINLDETAEKATEFLRTSQAPGTHLFEAPSQGASGMQSPLALQYGILGLPTMFLVGRDGKVISRTLQATDLEASLKGSL